MNPENRHTYAIFIDIDVNFFFNFHYLVGLSWC